MSPCAWVLLVCGVAAGGLGFLAGAIVVLQRGAWRDVTELERHPDDGRTW